MEKAEFKWLAGHLDQLVWDFLYPLEEHVPRPEEAAVAAAISRKLNAVCATDEERLVWLKAFVEAVGFLWVVDTSDSGADRDQAGWDMRRFWAIVADATLADLNARGRWEPEPSSEDI